MFFKFHRHSLSLPYEKMGTQKQEDDNFLRAIEITDYPQSHPATFAPPKSVFIFQDFQNTK